GRHPPARERRERIPPGTPTAGRQSTVLDAPRILVTVPRTGPITSHSRGDQVHVHVCEDKPPGGAPHPNRERRMPMAPGPNLGETLLGIEGLALLRLASDGDSSARRAR